MQGSRNCARGRGSRPNFQKTALTYFSPQLILQIYSGLSMVYFNGGVGGWKNMYYHVCKFGF